MDDLRGRPDHHFQIAPGHPVLERQAHHLGGLRLFPRTDSESGHPVPRAGILSQYRRREGVSGRNGGPGRGPAHTRRRDPRDRTGPSRPPLSLLYRHALRVRRSPRGGGAPRRDVRAVSRRRGAFYPGGMAAWDRHAAGEESVLLPGGGRAAGSHRTDGRRGRDPAHDDVRTGGAGYRERHVDGDTGRGLHPGHERPRPQQTRRPSTVERHPVPVHEHRASAFRPGERAQGGQPRHRPEAHREPDQRPGDSRPRRAAARHAGIRRYAPGLRLRPG